MRVSMLHRVKDNVKARSRNLTDEVWKSKQLAQVVSNISGNVGYRIRELDELSSMEGKVTRPMG